MTLKNYFGNIVINFSIKHDNIKLVDIDILEILMNSLNGFKFINKNKPFNELIKTQQQHSKFILIDKDLNHCDEFRFLIKVIYNYLTETDQHKNFILENIEINIDSKSSIVIYDTDILRDKFNIISFSPTIRSEWSQQPDIMEKIIRI